MMKSAPLTENLFDALQEVEPKVLRATLVSTSPAQAGLRAINRRLCFAEGILGARVGAHGKNAGGLFGDAARITQQGFRYKFYTGILL